jgi:hypothetical protein
LDLTRIEVMRVGAAERSRNTKVKRASEM